MSNKKLLFAALTVVAAIAVAVPFTGRTANIGSSLRRNMTELKSGPVERATTLSTEEDVPQVVSLQVTPAGFEPRETIVSRGRFLILLQNRTGRRDLKFWVARENEGRLAESERERRDWKAWVQLTPGTYTVGETHHLEWKSVIRVTN